ncbi:MAG: glycosyltransferase [Chroococcidiopsidaceae cyanobacterium CP_BM_ER_R8_30]|nr:glycosyltransferase [Chroococcidiopsidaceae cyanobacterium CP_BM_ER_R8_30]
MSNHPLVSILINNYNYGRFLAEAINSALNQTYSNTEIVVVDDGSTDNSREVIENYGDKIIPLFKKNGGQASAFNAGFAASRGEIILLLDADDIFLPNKVAEVIDVFEQYKTIGWCFHPTKLVSANAQVCIKKRANSVAHECDLREQIKSGKLESNLTFIIPPTSGLCFRSSLLKLILPMPEAIRIISDSYLQCIALALSTGFVMDKELVLQRIHGNNAYTLRNDKQKMQARMHVLLAYWIRIKFPFLSKFTNNLLGVGMGLYWDNNGGVEAEYKELIKNYLSLANFAERFKIRLRFVYYYLKRKYNSILDIPEMIDDFALLCLKQKRGF